MTRFRSLRLMLNLVPVMLRLRHAKPSDLNTIRALVRAQFPEVTQVSIPTLAAWIDQPNAFPPLLVDVRSQSEFQVSHLRNAVNTASVQEIKGLAAASDPARPIVLYCAVGYRSSAIVRQLQQAGCADVFSLDGAIFQWANEGRDLYRGVTSVKTVHPYDLKWAGLLKPDCRAAAAL